MPHHRSPAGLLTPAMRGVLERITRAGHVPMHALSPSQARAAYAAGSGVLELPVQALHRVEDHYFRARDGQALLARLYAPSAKRLPVLLYFHGGGFTIGSVQTHDALCRRLSHLGHCAVVSVDYRLAPEHRFPCAFEDAWDALQWLSRSGALLGLDCERIAVGGDSAGGTLAATCAIAARDHALALSLQLLFYPGTCARQETPSHTLFAHGFVLEKEHLRYFFAHYLGDGDHRDDWRFAPLDGLAADGHPVDLEGLAPAWLGLAQCDPLVDEGVLYADRLRLAGVPVELEIYRGVVHEFIKMGRAIPEALQAHADAAQALRKAFDHG